MPWICVVRAESATALHPASAAATNTAGQASAKPARAADVGDVLRREIEADWVQRDRLFSAAQTVVERPRQVERPKQEAPSNLPTPEDAAAGCDGIKTGRWGFHTASGEQDPWWQVDLGKPCRLDRIVIYNRTDGDTAPRTRNIRVLVAADPQKDFALAYQHNGQTFYGVKEQKPLVVDFKGKQLSARVVRLMVPGRCSFALDEVEVYAADDPKKNIALGRPAAQKSVLPQARASLTRAKKKAQDTTPLAAPVPVGEAQFLMSHTREVVERAKKLAARLAPQAASTRLAPLVAELGQLDRRLAKSEKAGPCARQTRRDLYFQARWLARRIALTNAALDFDKIVFVKRRHPTGLFHMVHQFYGFGARPGGGLFVLSDPWSSHPKLTDLAAAAVVEDGRLRGQTLAGGAFLAPELSYDGQTILFAYSQCQAQGIEWSPRSSFHIFQVNADGSGLRQLTDGKWNDLDPCFLPNGRIAFISERRGGYLRCGGSSPPYDSPTYTLHSMAADGRDILCLSYHETHEWQPSVDQHGMIVYTRWDYVDRDTNAAHHLWTCFPDGRDPRSFHGNYPQRRESRPWMEMDIRAVPGSPKYVATAAAHHGVAFGSLVLIDPRVEDDGAMSQVERITPDVPLPEAEGGKKLVRQYMAYATPWPLSEDDYLCAYGSLDASHGLWWIDRFGNRELIYLDPSIPSLSPIPLRARPQPPLLPEATTQSAARGGKNAVVSAPATIAVMNVYDSDFAWPAGVKIDALRIIQVLPKTTPRANSPRIGTANGTNARCVLGTVPVESDGSARFEAPVGKPIYFQALDSRGMAVQSMRSATYVHPGEQLVCRGCHEPKYRSPPLRDALPLALKRPPSKIRPDVEGSNPFNYVRLVQPVLDRHCVACHQERRAIDLGGAIEAKFGWSRSYQNLAPKFGFYFHSSNGSINSGVHGGSRTTAGQFGARASKLIGYLDQRHYGVRLADEEWHRLVLWLDCNSEFFGAYENTQAQSLGKLVRPALE